MSCFPRCFAQQQLHPAGRGRPPQGAHASAVAAAAAAPGRQQQTTADICRIQQCHTLGPLGRTDAGSLSLALLSTRWAWRHNQGAHRPQGKLQQAARNAQPKPAPAPHSTIVFCAAYGHCRRVWCATVATVTVTDLVLSPAADGVDGHTPACILAST